MSDIVSNAQVDALLRQRLTPAQLKDRENFAGWYATKRRWTVTAGVMAQIGTFMGVATLLPPVGVAAALGGGGACVGAALGLGDAAYAAALQEGAKKWDILHGYGNLYA
ncbi:hypothetical protein IE81DRAFT_349534 [Ceraceosorus guamensis]|uniref:Uncharacterized protein n=1 Tax=Ceraceosorus guamensis TaxID=1522189 RepID=A0A316VRH3_9BASI|nr:hypothetical protein IE81DRAFT_349534 [Ceraceosorus guamensis]PWN40112.1 hypothetical protein IE81DRAFT_349534 [Ceraceosorus guamensis]